jgi:hypothetical protein
MKVGIVSTLVFLTAAFLSGCRDESAVKLAPVPLLEYQWGQDADDLKDALERKINLNWNDKFTYYFTSSRRNRGLKNDIRKKMDLITDGAPRDKAMVKRLGIDRMITFRGNITVADLNLSPTFLFADERLVTVVMSPVLLINMTEAGLESYYRSFKSELGGWAGDFILDSLRQSEDGRSVIYNLRWQNERTSIHFFASLRTEDGLFVATLVYQDRSHVEKMAATKPPVSQ